MEGLVWLDGGREKNDLRVVIVDFRYFGFYILLDFKFIDLEEIFIVIYFIFRLIVFCKIYVKLF